MKLHRLFILCCIIEFVIACAAAYFLEIDIVEILDEILNMKG
ncbi:MAG: hypothetical protein ACM3O3_09765 [Syntrophothermus sp.]